MKCSARAGQLVASAVLFLSLLSPAAGSVYTGVVLADNPVAYWPLNETSTASPAADLSTKNHNGVYVGSITLGTPGAYPALGTAATFDSADDQIDVTGVGTDYRFANNFTLEAWVKRRATGAVNMILSTSDWYMGQYNSGGSDRFRFTTLGVLDYNFNTVFPYDTWTHLVAVMDGSNAVSLYMNGQFMEKRTHTAPGNTNNTALRIGSFINNGLFDWLGEIDEVAVYGKALSPGQIANHYSAGVTGLVAPPAGLLVYHFDEGAGGVVRDSVYPRHADGAIQGGAAWATGKFGGALAFDGVDDYVRTTAFPAGSYPQVTVEMWVNWGAKQGKQVLFNDQSGDSIWMNLDTNGADKLDVYLGDTTNKGYHSSNAAVPRGAWTHLAFTYDDAVDELKLYINGVLDRTVTTSGLVNLDSTVAIGRAEVNLEYYQGLMDELAVYAAALTPGEIYARFLAGPPQAVPEPSTFALAVLGLAGIAGGARAARVRRRGARPNGNQAP